MHANEVQVMSAGAGIFHSEMNASKNEWVKLFQIWVIPDKMNVKPRYDQKLFTPELRKNQWQEIIKPDFQTSGDAIFIHQQAWLSLTDLDAGFSITYTNKKMGNGAYVFVIDGTVEINNTILNRRDALGVTEYHDFTITANSFARLLVIDVPMLKLEF
jgi:redox-sensitive bicupin YhaK (pirin superfamily)